MRSQNRAQSKSFEVRRRRRFLITICVIAIVFGGFISISSYISYIKPLAIYNVEVYGVDPKVAQNMQAAAFKALQGSYLGLLSKSNSVIYPESAIKREVASASPSISTIQIKRSSLHTIAISVNEKSGNAIVCVDLPELGIDESSNENCYIADKNGFIYKKVTKNDPVSFNKYYVPEFGSDPLGKYATSTEVFNDLQDFVEALKVAEIKVLATLVKADSEYEFYALNPEGESIVVIHASQKVSLDEQRDNLIAFWQKMVTLSRSKKQTTVWNDIKLQYPPNVYYTEAQ